MDRTGAGRVRSGASLGVFTFRDLRRRDRPHFPGLSTLRELLGLLRTVPTGPGWGFRPRGRRTAGSGSRTRRTGR